MTNMKTVVSLLIDHFKEWGVTHIFGIPGKSIVPILTEIEDNGLEFIVTRHENGAGFAASGYSLIKDTIGVAIGTSGPGGTNLLTSAGQAKAYHLPVLFITGHPSIKDTGKALGQDSSMFGTDLVKMFEPVTLFSARVERKEQFELYFKHAIEKACVGVKGPVHLSIPFEVLLEEINPFKFELPREVPVVSTQLEKVIHQLNQAENPILFLGKGVQISKAYEEVKWLAEKWGIPVITTPGGKGTFSTNHSLSLGAFGLGGTERATKYLQSNIDLMIVIGSKLSDMSLAGFKESYKPKKIIQFDIDSTFSGKSISVPTLVIQGDAKRNLEELKKKVNGTRSTPLAPINLLAQEQGNEKNQTEELSESSHYISAASAIKELRRYLPDETILFGDDGSHTFFAIKHYDIYEPGTFFFDDVFGTMGHAIGYAIGAKIASPQKPIVCLTGDGCTLMHGTEIASAVNEGVAVVFVVFNNGGLDMVDKGMKQWLNRSVGAKYKEKTNIKKFAESLGAIAYRCRNKSEIEDAIRQTLEYKNIPSVIEVMVDPKEIPPILDRI